MRFAVACFVFVGSTVSGVACAPENEVGDDEHGHDYAELVQGQGDRALALRVAGSWSPDADVVAAGDQQTVQYDGAPPWDGGVNCAGNATPGARTLRDVLVEAFPQIGSVGIYNCRVIGGTNSMSLHGVGRALDVMIPTESGDADNGAGDPIAAWLIENAETLGLQLIIWDHAIWSTSRAPGSRMRAYGGENPHVDHLHVEVNEAAGFENLPWYGSPVGPGPNDGSGSEPCPALPAGGGVVDAGACQQRFGPGEFWRSESAGQGGQLFWTNAFQNDAPSNWARTTVKVDGATGDYDVDTFLDPAFAQFENARYRITAADGEHVVVVDQGARARENGGWARLGRFAIPADGLVVVVEDNSDSAVPADARRIVVDAVRLSVAAAVVPPEPGEPEEPTPEEPTPEEPTPTPEQPTPEQPTPEQPIDDDGPVLDADDPGTAETRVVVANGAKGCAATPTTSPLGLGLLLLLLRRRRR